MDTTNRKGMEKLYLKRLFILLFLFPASLWAQDALSETPVRSTDTEAINEIVTGLNTVWMLLAAMLVFFMQPGFALVEAGFIRTKNTANVLMKNLIDFMFGSILFWFIGFGWRLSRKQIIFVLAGGVVVGSVWWRKNKGKTQK